MKARRMCRTAMMTALMCVLGPLTLPIGTIPISLTTLAVYLAGALLGAKRAVLATAMYLLIGALGMPVFSGFTAGLSIVFGVTGGYLIGYLPCAAIVGWAAGRERGKWMLPMSMAAGTAICYLMGSAWFVMQTKTPPMSALVSCVLPFLPGDLLKIIAATAAARSIQRSLRFR